MTPLQIRKKLLMAEADVLRAQWEQDVVLLRDGLSAWKEQAKSATSYGLIATTLMGTFSIFRKPPSTGEPQKSSLLSKILSGARTAASVWALLRSRKS